MTNNEVYEACRTGDTARIAAFGALGVDKWNIGLAGACFGGHRDIAAIVRLHDIQGYVTISMMLSALQMIARGANNWNFGLANACEGRHRDLVTYVSHGTTYALCS
jgi:hypothetical protein